ncbi:transposase [bacterium]|nr:transposase [bacterium]
MSTYTQIYYHIVFATKNREPVLTSEGHESLFRYIWGIINHKNCHLYRLNSLADHLCCPVGAMDVSGNNLPDFSAEPKDSGLNAPKGLDKIPPIWPILVVVLDCCSSHDRRGHRESETYISQLLHLGVRAVRGARIRSSTLAGEPLWL